MEGPHNHDILVNSIQQSACLPFGFHHVGKDFVDMFWSIGLEVVLVFESSSMVTQLILLMLIISLLSPLFDSLDSLSIPPASFEMLGPIG